MNFKQLVMRQFMSHKSSTVDLPKSGVVLVTGDNGSGKSSIIEAAAYAGWGKTLRGTTPWNEERGGSLDASFDGIEVQRGKTKLAISAKEKESVPEFATKTKAQSFLETRVGSFDVWRRCAVFSSQDASHFTLATDGERKRLLETLLGLGKFDVALADCRAEKKKSDLERTCVERELDSSEIRANAQKLRLSEAKEVLETLQAKKSAASPKSADNCADKLEDEKEYLGELLDSANVLSKKLGKLEGAKAELRHKLVLADQDKCSTCGQEINADFAKELKSAVKDQALSIKSKHKSISVSRELNAKETSEVRDNISNLTEKLHEERSELYQAKQAKETRDRLAATAKDAKEALKKLGTEKKARSKELNALSYESEVLRASELALGLRGIRANVLGNALSGLETIANSWLDRIAGGGIRLEVLPYTDKKTGGQKDAIALKITGAGGGNGYRAASGGQRRRIDVAILLALSELAQAANQHNAGTLFFDEVFDSLDSEGVLAVGNALADMAKERAVVVISHSEDVVNLLNPKLHYRVDDGRVSKV